MSTIARALTLVLLLAGALPASTLAQAVPASEIEALRQETIQQQTGWAPDEDFYRFYIGRDADGRLVAAGVFLTEFTIHGPVRVAVGLGPDGKVRGVAVVEVTEETYPWVKVALDRDVTRPWIGQGSQGMFTTTGAGLGAMPEFYTQVIGDLVRRAVVLYDVVLKPAA